MTREEALEFVQSGRGFIVTTDELWDEGTYLTTDPLGQVVFNDGEIVDSYDNDLEELPEDGWWDATDVELPDHVRCDDDMDDYYFDE